MRLSSETSSFTQLSSQAQFQSPFATPPVASARGTPSLEQKLFMPDAGPSKKIYSPPAARQDYVYKDPIHGEVPVPVDTKSASRETGEKRQRQAGASARFRERKKRKEENDLHELREKVRWLEARLQHYLAERNRLRDVVLQNPEIRELAYQGPPSPTSIPREGSFGEVLIGAPKKQIPLALPSTPSADVPSIAGDDGLMKTRVKPERTDQALDMATTVSNGRDTSVYPSKEVVEASNCMNRVPVSVLLS